MLQENRCRSRRSLMWLRGFLRSASRTRGGLMQSPTTSSTEEHEMAKNFNDSRRGFLVKLGMIFNGLVASALAVPVGRYLLSSVTRGRSNGYLSWVSLGRVSDFPEGETRL